MKKHLITLLVVIFVILFGITIVWTANIQHPAPFQKAKEIALQVPIDANGEYLWQATISRNGQRMTYQIAHANLMTMDGQRHDIVVIIRSIGNHVVAIATCAICNDFKYIDTARGVMYFTPIDREKAIEAAFRVFRELVENNFI